MLSWFKGIYWSLWWKYHYWKHPEDRRFIRSEIWQREIKKLLLEDLKSQKFTRIIE